MSHHPVVDIIKGTLEERHVWFEHFEHESVRTSEEASKVRSGYVLAQGTKALISRVRDRAGQKKFVMFVVPGSARFDVSKVKSECGFRDIRFATEDEVAEITGGVLPGGIPPWGNIFGLEVYADRGVFNNEKIIFNAGDRTVSIGMRSEDYAKIVNPNIVAIV